MIPNFDQLLRPLLQLAAEGRITRRFATDQMAKQFTLSQDEVAQRIPSGGSTLIANRCGWAMTFLTKGSLIAKVAKGTYEATERGRKYLSSHPTAITHTDLKQIPGWEEAWELGRQKRRLKREAHSEAELPEVLSTATPEEAIAEGIKTLRNDLRVRLLTAILDQSPEFFEKLVQCNR